MPSHYTAKDAAHKLGISLKTLYAYASRGKIRTYPHTGRTKLYDASDIDALFATSKERRDPDLIARQSLSPHGRPILTSHVSAIKEGMLYYKGRSLTQILDDRLSFGAVASLLWHNDPHHPIVFKPVDDPVIPSQGITPLTRALMLLPWLETKDLHAHTLKPKQIIHAGTQITGAIMHSLPHCASLSQSLAKFWHLPPLAAPLLNNALIVSAEHELNASVFATRIAASTRATPYAAAQAGLATLMGSRQGGTMLRIGAWIRDVESHPKGIQHGLEARLRRGQSLPGLGHPLYPQGDPRANVLWNQMLSHTPWAKTLEPIVTLLHAAKGLVEDPHPAIDLMLVAMMRALSRPEEDALYLFALARSVGWTAHILEQVQHPELIRPRASSEVR